MGNELRVETSEIVDPNMFENSCFGLWGFPDFLDFQIDPPPTVYLQ
jgi:hypothetical protein